MLQREWAEMSILIDNESARTTCNYFAIQSNKRKHAGTLSETGRDVVTWSPFLQSVCSSYVQFTLDTK